MITGATLCRPRQTCQRTGYVFLPVRAAAVLTLAEIRSLRVLLAAHVARVKVWRVIVRYAGWRLAVSVLGGIAAGAALAALMRLIHRALTLPAVDTATAALSFLGLLALYFVGNVAAQHALSDAAERLQWQLRLTLLRQVLAAPLRQTERTGFPRLLNLLGADVKRLADYICDLPDAVVNVTIALGCFGYMAWLSPTVFLFNLVFVALAAGCYLVPERLAQRIGHRAAAANDQHTRHLHYAIGAVKNLLLSRARRADFLTGHFSASGTAVRRLNRQSRLVHLLAERFAEVMVLGNVACLLFALPRLIDLPVATATGILLAAIFARQPLKDSLDILPRTQRARIAIERMQEAGLDPFAATEVESAETTPESSMTFAELSLDEVSFRYESDHGQPGFVSGPFSLHVRAGEIVFIAGGNGAGKTTLAKLLCGLYAPHAGTLTLDGAAVTSEADRAALRARFTAVFTEDPLFEHVLGVPPEDATIRGRQLLRELQLDRKVSLENGAFTTTELSQGQRRRLVLLAALLEDRPIVLLDEWAADQDPGFREFFYSDLLPGLRAQGKTVIAITHDDRYFDRADRVLKLDQGRLVAGRDGVELPLVGG